MIMSKMIRMTEETSGYLDELAKETSKPKQDLLAQAIWELYKRNFFERLNEAYINLKKDPVAWEEELAERRLWDVTLLDGLNEDNDYEY